LRDFQKLKRKSRLYIRQTGGRGGIATYFTNTPF
jgi:hypothetical protein